jgi:hypothetical protein
MATAVRRAAIAGAALLMLGWARDAASDERALRVIVNVYDYAVVEPWLLLAAEEAAARIFAASGIEIAWRQKCYQPECGTFQPAPQTEVELTVYILTREMTSRWKAATGVMGATPPGSRLAYIFYARVMEFTFMQSKDRATVLGNVIAHEMGHLLLPGERHTHDGMMRASWDNGDLMAAAQGKMHFTERQNARMRARLGRMFRDDLLARGDQSVPPFLP